jgi:release factor glutamine methyltransferase
MNTFIIKWNHIQEKYSESMIKSKKLPEFYDFYNCSKDFLNVYEPAEDTFLMIDTLNLEKESIFAHIKNKIQNNSKEVLNTVEVGCGSGLVSATLVKMIKEIIIPDLSADFTFKHYCLDVNKDALELTKNLMKSYSLDNHVEVLESNLFSYFQEKNIDVKFDVIVFNPPYVTTDEEEFSIALQKKDISAAWAGGKSGSEVIYKFIENLENFITKPDTVVYLLLSEENEYEEIQSLMKKKFNFESEVK